ncbi:hypothetical protein Bpfe_031029 [Biomphalaria pfeifferi]|uniref:UrcA family protein n=1 Tax=Biomphalaria pfeifferi TaxID=112525 RepID=A0AAD8EUS9_BIOPF|nr:hypothetical protein Bpfe_031029 [Biomphalaria pfeifferi]
MKIRANVEMLAIVATIVSANLPQGTSVKITADETVDKATADTLTIGEVRKCSELANKKGTIETMFRAIADCKVSGGTTVVAPPPRRLCEDRRTGRHERRRYRRQVRRRNRCGNTKARCRLERRSKRRHGNDSALLVGNAP